MYSQKRKKGNVGEEIVVNYLKRTGYEILEQNYLKRFGEIDIVAVKDVIIHFIEVKSQYIGVVTHETSAFDQDKYTLSVTRGTEYEDVFFPEENVHRLKKLRLAKTIQMYMFERGIDEEVNFQVDIIAVGIDIKKRQAKLRVLEDVVLIT